MYSAKTDEESKMFTHFIVYKLHALYLRILLYINYTPLYVKPKLPGHAPLGPSTNATDTGRISTDNAIVLQTVPANSVISNIKYSVEPA